jgi:hypothetical protein
MKQDRLQEAKVNFFSDHLLNDLMYRRSKRRIGSIISVNDASGFISQLASVLKLKRKMTKYSS